MSSKAKRPYAAIPRCQLEERYAIVTMHRNILAREVTDKDHTIAALRRELDKVQGALYDSGVRVYDDDLARSVRELTETITAQSARIRDLVSEVDRLRMRMFSPDDYPTYDPCPQRTAYGQFWHGLPKP